MNDALTTLRRLCPGSARNARALAALLAFFVSALVASAAEVPCGGLTFSETFDGVQSPNLPAGWTASQGPNSGDPLWITSATTPYTAPNAAFTAVPDHVLDNRLDSPGFFSSAGPGTLYFRHKFDFQNGLDGAVLEVSAPNLNGGQFTEFTAATGYFVAGGYNGTITSPSNPLAGRSAWTGNSNGYFRTEAGVSTIRHNYGSPIRVRFRMASDESGSSGGWWVDHIAVQYTECSTPAPTPSPTPPYCSPHWSSGPAAPVAAAHSAGVFFPANGRFYVMGGRGSDAVGSDLMHPLEFDPVQNSWATKAATFPDNMVSDMVCDVLTDPSATPFIYCVGGSAAGGSTATSRLFRYDPVADSITQVAAPWPGNPGADTLPGGGAAAANKLYLLGGYQIGIGMTNKIWEFRPDTNVWVQKASVLPVPLGYLAVMASGNGISTAGGTVLESPGTLYDIANVFFYSTSGDQISARYPLPRQTSGARMFTTNLERKVLGGGIQNTSAHVDVFSNSWGVWLRGEDLAIARRNFAAATDGNRIWLTGGFSSDNTPLNSMEIYQCPASSPTPTASPTPTPTPTPTPSPTPPPTPTPIPTASATPTPTPTPTASPTPTPDPTATPPSAQALNISTRLRVETGDKVLIGGFIITGSAGKKVAIRAIGPSLASSGLTDVLADPTLELRGPNGALLAQNDNWRDEPFGGMQLTALGLAPQHSNESGMVPTIAPGAYTAIMAGKDQTTGIGLVEVYDVDAAAASQLANISTRGFVQTGNNVMIGGFILGNSSGATNVVVRARGPSLSQFGLNDVLADPTLELRNANGALLIANDNWQDDPASAAQLSVRGFALPHPLESGLFASLSPGAFTAILAGKNGGVGIGVVEIYGALTATNTLTVMSTADSGPGSLRQAIADAGAGDTIEFAPALNGQTIILTSAELVIDKNIIISGPGPNQLAVARSGTTGTSKFRIFHVLPGHVVLIAGLKISGGSVSGTDAGGGVRNDQSALTLNNCHVFYCAAGSYGTGGTGGGVYNSSGTLEINDSSISGNFADASCGGIYNTTGGTLKIRDSVVSGNYVTVQFSNPPQFVGSCGGIFNEGTAEMSNCAISQNTGGRYGGGIENRGSLSIADSAIDHNTTIGTGGGIISRGPLTITNSTISSNTASFKGLGNGGGIDAEGGSLVITDSTFSGNTVANSSSGRGCAIYIAGGTLQLQNTILNASGMGGSIHRDGGTVTSHGYNLSSDNGGGFLSALGDQTNTNPMLGPLQNNGGPTFTHALLSGSPAINAGNPAFSPPPSNDQRGPGYPRVSGGRIDVGSFELQP